MRDSNQPHLSDVLTDLAKRADNGLTLGDVLAAFGERSFGVPILILAAFSFIPFASALFGVPLLFITAQLTVGRRTMWLPKKFLNYRISGDLLQALVARTHGPLVKAEKVLQPRGWLFVSAPMERLVGLMCFILSVILFLPIPLFNFPPALALCLFALGLTEQDSWAMIAGWIVSIGTLIALVVFGGVVVAALAKLYYTLAAFVS